MADAAHEWEVRHDEGSGQVYYYNIATGEAVWEPPAGYESLATVDATSTAAQRPEWSEAYDETGRVYYVNHVTMETSWEPPEGFAVHRGSSSGSGDDESPAPVVSESMRPTTAQQMEQLNALLAGGDGDDGEEDVEDERDEGRDMRVQDSHAGDVSESAPGCDWMMFLNEADGVPYYYNHLTGECVWEAPAEFLAYHEQHEPSEPLPDLPLDGSWLGSSSDVPRTPPTASPSARIGSPGPPRTPSIAAAITPEFEDKVRRAIEAVSKTPVGSSRLLLVRTPTLRGSEIDLSSASARDPGAKVTPSSSRPMSSSGASTRLPSMREGCTGEDSVDNAMVVAQADPPLDERSVEKAQIMNEIQQELMLAESVVVIQCLARCFLARHRVEKKRQERQSALEREHEREREQQEARERAAREEDARRAAEAQQHAKAAREAEEQRQLVDENARVEAERQREEQAQRAAAEAEKAREQAEAERKVEEQRRMAEEAARAEAERVRQLEELVQRAAEVEQMRTQALAADQELHQQPTLPEAANTDAVDQQQEGGTMSFLAEQAPVEVEELQRSEEHESEATGVPTTETVSLDQPVAIPDPPIVVSVPVPSSPSPRPAPVAVSPPSPAQPVASEPAAPIPQPPASRPSIVTESIKSSIPVVGRRVAAPSVLDIATFFPPRQSAPTRSTKTQSTENWIRRKPIVSLPARPTLSTERREQQTQQRVEQRAAAQATQARDVTHWRQVYADAAARASTDRARVVEEQSARTEAARTRQRDDDAAHRQRAATPLPEPTNAWACRTSAHAASSGYQTLIKHALQVALSPDGQDDAQCRALLARQRLHTIDSVIARLQDQYHALETKTESIDVYLVDEDVADARLTPKQRMFQAQYVARLRKTQGEVLQRLALWQSRRETYGESSGQVGSAQSIKNKLVYMDNGDTLLHSAVWQGYRDVVESAIAELGADVNGVDNTITKWTLLHEACHRGDVQMVDVLLSHRGVVLDAQDLHGDTPLHVACRMGSTQIVQRLLAAGELIGDQADKKARGVLGHTSSCIEWFNLVNYKHHRAMDVATRLSLIEWLTHYDQELNGQELADPTSDPHAPSTMTTMHHRRKKVKKSTGHRAHSGKRPKSSALGRVAVPTAVIGGSGAPP